MTRDTYPRLEVRVLRSQAKASLEKETILQDVVKYPCISRTVDGAVLYDSAYVV